MMLTEEQTENMTLRMRNLTGSSDGNDFGYDNAQLVDATPQLDKSFGPQSVPTGGVSTLTFTVTNTDELAEKNGWDFTDTLPEGLMVASAPNIGGTCEVDDIAADAGAGEITITDGVLAHEQESCTITVDVTSAAPAGADESPKSYANCAENITAHAGINLPDCAMVQFYSEPQLEVNKESTGSGASRAGDTVSYQVTGSNTGTGDYTSENPAVVIDDLADVLDDASFVEGSLRATVNGAEVDPPIRDGNLIAWSGPLPAGQDVVITYDVTLTGAGNSHVANVAFPDEGPYDPDNPPTTPACGEGGSACTDFDLPGISMEKSADTAELIAGETITYTFAVENTGNTTLTDLVITETEFTGSSEMSAVTCDPTTLDPGQSVDCTATYEVTQTDVDRGTLDNTATATGTPPEGDPVISGTSEVNLPQDPAPGLSLVKSADPETYAAGDTITYTFAVENTGNVTLNDIVINEGEFTGSGELSDITCDPMTLAPGETVDCTATYEATRADALQGSITNTAIATGAPPGGGDPVASDPSEAEVTAEPAPGIALVKSASTDKLVAGEAITYTFVVENTGNTTLTDIVVTEIEFTGSGEMSVVTCDPTTLDPGESVDCTATYEVTQADVDQGAVTNTATATGTPPDGDDPVTSDPSEVEIAADQVPGISIVKSADRTELVAGETITYTFVVENTGNVTLNDVVVNETAFSGSGDMSAVTCDPTTLAPGETVDCTATYEVTQADVDRGDLSNEATATGTPPGDGDPVTSDPSEVSVPQDPAPGIEMTKTADRTDFNAGDTITYTFEVRNTGNISLTDVGVTEGEFSGSGDLSEITCEDGAASLAPGDTVNCTATYVATQADVDQGSITNSATATGTPSGGGDPVTSDPSEAEVTAEPAPSLSLVKSADPETYVAGDTITYTFAVENTGNVSLNDIVINEGEFTGSGELSEVTCDPTTLAPGGSVGCTATYVATQADVDQGSITNSATATGTPPAGDPVTSDPSEAEVTADQQPGIALTKSADTTELVAGETITYSFTVENTGNVTLTDLVITETEFTGSGDVSEITCDPTTLSPGDTVTCTATYEVTQADVDRGEITNTATATGTPSSGDPVTSDESEVTLPQDPAPEISIEKTASTDTLVAGETITYTFEVRNTGNVTLTDIGVTEGEFTGSGELSEVTCEDGAASLAPGAVVTCTATYQVTQADVDQGSVENTATSHGTPPGDGDPVVSDPDDAVVGVDPAPGISLVKSADRSDLVAGETITYSFVVTNTGNVTLSDVTVNETEFTGSGEMSEVTCADGAAALAPGDSVTCTATYEVTQADVDRGSLVNTATATGTSPNGDPVTSDPSEVDLPQDPKPGISLVKSSDTEVATEVGQTITYSFLVTNVGNTTLVDVGVTEGEFSGHGDLSEVTCPDEAASLLPGQSVTCTATYQVVAADLTGDPLTNTATADGTPPVGDPVTSDPSEVEIPARAQDPGEPGNPDDPGKPGPGGELPRTGAAIGAGLIGLAAALIAAGVTLLLTARQRKTDQL
ncbi:DUF7507 domain-containing protein [Brevibacterium salitolerans]